MKLLLIYKDVRPARQLAERVTLALQAKGVQVQAGSSSLLTDQSISGVEMVFVLGGDGLLLKTARIFAEPGTPILGVNFGTVGFLSSIEPDQLLPLLEEILQGRYRLERRMMIDLRLIRQGKAIYDGLALNEATIRTRRPHTIVTRLYVKDELYASYLGDGIICATPTGSTAYSYSAGGPIVDLSLPALVITPICPQLSSSRSLVIGMEAELILVIDGFDPHAGLSVDGEDEILLMKGDRISIKCSSTTSNLIQLKEISSAERVARKLDRLDRVKRGTIASGWE